MAAADTPVSSASTQQFVTELDGIHEELKHNIVEAQLVMIHITIWPFPIIPTLLPWHETIMSLGSNLSTHHPFNTPYSNPSWDPCTICAQLPFPILLIYKLPCLYILFLTLNIN